MHRHTNSLAIHLEKLPICRAAGRTTACTPCHFHQLQLLCFPGLSWRLHGNLLHGETEGKKMGKKISAQPLSGHLLFALWSECFPPLSWEMLCMQERPRNDFTNREKPLLFRYRFSNILRHAAARFCFNMIPTTQLLVLNVRHKKGAINVCCLDNSSKIKMNHQPANEHLQP